MNYTVKTEFLPAKEFLAIKGYVVVGDDSEADESADPGGCIGIIRRLTADGSAERLKKAAGSQTVYMLFSNTFTQKENKKSWVTSYDMVCENQSGQAEPSEFDIVKLEPSEYAVFDFDIDHEATMEQAMTKVNDDIIWGEWLPKSGYVSMLEFDAGEKTSGFAQIEQWSPLDPDADSFNLKTWVPIRKSS